MNVSSLDLLFFSRGRGRGHAIPDMAIVDALSDIAPQTRVVFASYGTGARTIAERGYPVIDMELSEATPYLQVLVRAGELMTSTHPRLVVSHEEFAALPAAKVRHLPTAFLIDFFGPPESLWMQSLDFADRIVFIERQGIFQEPPRVKGKVVYVGPVVRPMAFSRGDRANAREQLDLPSDANVLSVIPGSWANEERSPIHDLVVPAFEALPLPNKKLVWVAGTDYRTLSSRLRRLADVRVLESCWPIEKLMVASNLVITKANRGTTLELEFLGVRSISLSHGLNPIDEAITARIRSNLALSANGIDVSFLSEAVRQAVVEEHETVPAPSSALGNGGATAAAMELARFVEQHPSRPPGNSLLPTSTSRTPAAPLLS
jgi:UDP-N-acetylglucosamine:LPS N-acetylglucosamine transferase